MCRYACIYVYVFLTSLGSVLSYIQQPNNRHTITYKNTLMVIMQLSFHPKNILLLFTPHSSWYYIHIWDNIKEKKDVFTLSLVSVLLSRLKLSIRYTKPDNTELPCRVRRTMTVGSGSNSWARRTLYRTDNNWSAGSRIYKPNRWIYYKNNVLHRNIGMYNYYLVSWSNSILG